MQTYTYIVHWGDSLVRADEQRRKETSKHQTPRTHTRTPTYTYTNEVTHPLRLSPAEAMPFSDKPSTPKRERNEEKICPTNHGVPPFYSSSFYVIACTIVNYVHVYMASNAHQCGIQTSSIPPQSQDPVHTRPTGEIPTDLPLPKSKVQNRISLSSLSIIPIPITSPLLSFVLRFPF